MIRNYQIIITLLAFNISVETQAAATPLFQDEKPLKLVLETDMAALVSDKSDNPEYTTGRLISYLEDQKIDFYEIKVRARGKTRRLYDLCNFPPLKINFKKSEVKNTVFEGQDKLKLVIQCKDEVGFRNYLLEEYMIYKVYNQLTEQSYRVRLVEIIIKDTKRTMSAMSFSGFFIEDTETLAKRIDAKIYDKPIYHPDSCESTALDRMAIFQYMIGNTDWYVNTRHNIDILQLKSTGDLIPIPYDFDFSGVINTPYATPSKEIPITKVTQRYFKGSCRDQGTFDQTFQQFIDNQSSIWDLYEQFELLPGYVARKSLRYYARFYKIITDPSQAESAFLQSCISIPWQLMGRKN